MGKKGKNGILSSLSFTIGILGSFVALLIYQVYIQYLDLEATKNDTHPFYYVSAHLIGILIIIFFLIGITLVIIKIKSK